MDDPKRPIRSNPHSVYAGTAAEDLAPDSTVLKIICPELIPNAAFGTVGAGITTGTVSLKDRDGNPIASTHTTSNHVVATWEGSSNARYAPLIRKGEPVEVYRTANQDKFFWRTTGRGRDFRTTDRVHIEVAATDPTKPGVAKDDTNTYSVMIDSENKKVALKTSKANGEVCAFSAEFDLAQGTFHISDDGEDPGNRLFLDTGTKTGTPVFQINLSSGVTLKMEGDHAFIKIPGKLEIDVGERFIVKSPITVFNLDKSGTVIINALNVAVNSGKDIILLAGNIFGVSAVSSKIGGVLIASAARITTLVRGAFGSTYTPPTIDRPQESRLISSNNTADTDTSGTPYQ